MVRERHRVDARGGGRARDVTPGLDAVVIGGGGEGGGGRSGGGNNGKRKENGKSSNGQMSNKKKKEKVEGRVKAPVVRRTQVNGFRVWVLL